MHDRMMEYYRRRERLEYFHINQEIHVEIVRLARNETLRSMHSRLHTRMKRSRFRGNDIPENWARAVADHEELIAAFQRRDAQTVSAVLQRHLDASWIRLANSLGIDPDTLTPLDRENGS